MKLRLPSWKVNTTVLTACVALWCLVALNVPFWSRVFEIRPLVSVEDALYLLSFAILAFIVINLFLMPLTLIRPVAKPLLALAVLLAGFASYFVSAYGVLIDKVMIRNVFETNGTEADELVNLNLILYVGLLGVLPAFLVMRAGVIAVGWRRELAHRGVALGLTVLGVGVVAAAFYQDHASTFRNNRELRHMIVPVNYLAGVGSYVGEITRPDLPYQAIGRDARLGEAWSGKDAEKPLIMVLVVGETTRAADFGLDGYARQTTPKLAAIPELINFSKVSSCGTSTAISVPCMFSDLGRERFDPEEAKARDNLIDIVKRVGFEVQWFGNNTSCQGVCREVPEIRAPREDYPQYCIGDNPCMDGAIFDMFGNTLANPTGRRFVVLHTLGNHGPGYHLRYPKAFEKFTPVCRETDFSKCDVASIVNAYDNEVLYTDHLLAETIQKLAALGDRADTALIYVSDHGESLGENGIFLHALPYAVAPNVQTHVPMVFWASPGFANRMRIDMRCVAARNADYFSHNNLFHSVLGLLNIETKNKSSSLDMFKECSNRTF
jgi:lipid A ethanolaminephosphotransferase